MRYILYCRKSTDTEDKQVLSLESQEKELLDLAAAQGLNVLSVLRESKSAKAEGRPVFASALSMIQAKEADAILCWKLDRLARNMADAGRIIDLLQRGVIKQIRTHDAVHHPADNVLMLAVQLGMANQYIRDLSENVKRGNRAKLERGEWPNHAPFGYTNDKNTKTLLVDPVRKSIVLRIFELYSIGSYSMAQVANQIHAEGFRTGTGTKIGKSRIEMTLKNPFYFGMMLRDGKYYPGKHRPIISRELFDKAQEVLAETSRPRDRKHSFAYRGLIVCADCSCIYTTSLKKGHQYYHCTNGKGTCEAHRTYLRSEPATELVAESLGNIRFDDEIIGIMYEASREKYADKYIYTEAIQKRLEGQLEALERQELAAFEDSSSGLLRRELYERKMIEIKNSRTLIQKELNDLTLRDGLATLEPTRNIFVRANTAQNRFIEAGDEQKRIIASEILWNLLVRDGKTEEVRYKMPYEVMAKSPKKGDLQTMLRDLDSNQDKRLQRALSYH